MFLRHVHHPTSLTRSTCLLGLHRVTGSIVFSRDYSNDSNGLGCPTRDFRLDDKEMNALWGMESPGSRWSTWVNTYVTQKTKPRAKIKYKYRIYERIPPDSGMVWNPGRCFSTAAIQVTPSVGKSAVVTHLIHVRSRVTVKSQRLRPEQRDVSKVDCESRRDSQWLLWRS